VLVDIRTWGLWIAAAGVVAQLSVFGDTDHPAFIAGSGVALAGIALALAGPWIYGTRQREIRPASRSLRVGTPFWLILVLALGAIAASAASATSGSSTTTALAVTAATHTHAGLTPGIESGNGSSPCEQSGPPASEGQSEHGHRGPSPQEPITDPATRELLGQQLATAREVALSFPTAADARAAGYVRITPYLPCIGSHWIKAPLMDGTFDVTKPEMLLYDSSGLDGRIIGLSYYVISGSQPPEGFAGPNDHWHQHIGLCISAEGVVGNEQTTPLECAKRGGRKADGSNAWMVHAWVVPGWESAWGVFSGEHPELGKEVPR